ncbi:MAG: NusG domain II-containing protein [Anaerococcus prevotii]|nr:NusG domain II-containing protein [Anaerococcus prevotii]
MKIKKGDIYVIGFLLIFSLAFAFAISNMTSREKGNVLVIEQDSKVIKEVPLDKDDEFRIEYGGHFNIVKIKDGKAYVSDADCNDQICVHMAPIHDVGETIICLPHRLFMEVYSTDDANNSREDKIDKVVR